MTATKMDRPLKDPGIQDGEAGAYRVVIDGEEAATVRFRVEARDGEAPSYVASAEAILGGGLGSYSGEMTFARIDGTLRSEHYRLETRYRDRLVARDEGWFRDVKGLNFGGRLEPYPKSVTPLIGCAIGLRGLDFEGRESRTMALWLANTVYWELHAKVEKPERVRVPVGELHAWKVRVRPGFKAINSQLDRLIGLFLPPFHLHFEREAPHRMLRFEFPTGPFPWNPRAVIEATELTDHRE